MTHVTPSRVEIAGDHFTPYQRTLADIVGQIRERTELPKRKREEMVSALGTLARALGRPTEQVPAQPHILNRQRRKIPAAAVGLTPRSWSNVWSLAVTAFEVTGCYVRPEKYYPPFSASWREQIDRIHNDHVGYGLSRFGHFADGAHWAPQEIGDEHFERYRHHLATETITADPEELDRTTRKNWNWACKHVEGWVGKPVSVPGRQRIRHSYWLRWSDFPSSLDHQVHLFLKSRAEFDILKEGASRPMSPRTIQGDEQHLRAFFSALVCRGRAPESLTDLRDLAKLDVLEDGLRFFLAKNGGQTSSYTSGIAATLAVVAKYLATQTPPAIDEEQLEGVHKLLKKVKYIQRGVTEKNKALLRLFVDQKNVAKLLFLPSKLIGDVQLQGKPTVRDALRVQAALAIEILLVFPIRESNLVSLNFKKNIVEAGPHKGAEVLIVIPGADVKNGKDLQAVLPKSAVDLLHLYRTRYLPLLASNNEGWLFPGQKGSHKHPQAFGPQLKRVIYRETGLPINVHFFRHLSAKLWLDRNPGHFRVMQDVLGHKSEKTLLKFYAEFSSIQALELYDAHVLKLRDELAHLVKPPRGRRGKGNVRNKN